MSWVLLLAVLLLTGCAHSDPWSKRDTVLYGVTLGVLAADAYTTSRIQYTAGVYEVGPVARRVLGSQPRTSDTVMYFGTLAVSNYFIGRALPAKWRPYWYGLGIAHHGYVIRNNCNDGLCE